MMSDTGKIIICRSMRDCGFYKDPYAKAVFFDLLLDATSEEVITERGIKLFAGECITTTRKLADNVGIKSNTVTKAIKHLESLNEISRRFVNHITIFKVVRFMDFNECITENSGKNRKKFVPNQGTKSDSLSQIGLQSPKSLSQIGLQSPKSLSQIGLQSQKFVPNWGTNSDAPDEKKCDTPYLNINLLDNNLNNIYNNSTNARERAQARGGGGEVVNLEVEQLNYSDFINRLKSYTSKVEVFCMNNQIDVETYWRLVDVIVNEWELENVEHKDYRGFVQHLHNRMRYKIKIVKEQKNGISDVQQARAQRMQGYAEIIAECRAQSTNAD